MESVGAKWLFALIFSFLVCAYLVPIFIALAKRLRFLDDPDGVLKKQTHSIPYLGGLAIYCGFLCGLALTIPLQNHIALLLIGCTLLLFIGLIDDLLVMKPYQKFFGQCLAALAFIKGGFYLKEHFFYTFWHIPISFLWIISVINAFNLVDVMDGLATSVALVAAIAFFGVAWFFNQPEQMILLAAFIGSLVAFLVYNRPNATIYMGDAGALFVGGFLATIPFLLPWSTHNGYGFLAPAIILAVPLLELVSLIVIRTYKQIPFYQGSRDHFSCYLQDNGWSKMQVLGYTVAMGCFLVGASALFITNIISVQHLPPLAITFLAIWMLFLVKPSQSPF